MSTAAALDLLLTAIIEGPAAVQALLASFQQRGELTDEQFKALGEKAELAFAGDHWKTDPK